MPIDFLKKPGSEDLSKYKGDRSVAFTKQTLLSYQITSNLYFFGRDFFSFVLPDSC